MSEHQAEPTSADLANAGPTDAAATPPHEVEAPELVPALEAAGEAAKAEIPKAGTAKADERKSDATPSPGKLLIMSPGDRTWQGSAGLNADAAKAGEMPGNRRMSAMVAVVALATVAGALGGALATAGLGHLASGDQAAAQNSALEASVTRIDAEMLALKASVEHNAKTGLGQFNRNSDRLDKVEKAQAEPLARLAKLGEAVDKLRAAQQAPAPVAAAPVAAKEITGAIAPVAAAAAPVAPAKPEVARLPTIEGWVLRDVGNGGALIEGRQGMFEVYAGDPIPGLGRVDAIRKQDGRWVVVTSKGLIVAR